ncbi:MAG: ABC transporter permease [Lachnospiraceae bacterium]
MLDMGIDSLDECGIEEARKVLKKEQTKLRIHKFTSNKLAVIGGMILLVVVTAAVFAPLLSPYDPYEMTVSKRLYAPGAQHLFGTDTFGRDLFTRVLYGSRISLVIGASVSLISLIIGMFFGLYASYYKPLDNALMRICDGLNAVPASLLAIAFMAVLGASVKNVIISLAVVYIPNIARITRGSALSVKEQTYIEAMRALGAKPSHIIWRHIAANVLCPVIVQASFIFANAIITEAALSFLGVGVPVPTPSWGNILYEGKAVIFKAWWMIFFPGICTAVSVLGLNLFGDGLRDVLDPQTN